MYIIFYLHLLFMLIVCPSSVFQDIYCSSWFLCFSLLEDVISFFFMFFHVFWCFRLHMVDFQIFHNLEDFHDFHDFSWIFMIFHDFSWFLMIFWWFLNISISEVLEYHLFYDIMLWVSEKFHWDSFWDQLDI